MDKQKRLITICILLVILAVSLLAINIVRDGSVDGERENSGLAEMETLTMTESETQPESESETPVESETQSETESQTESETETETMAETETKTNEMAQQDLLDELREILHAITMQQEGQWFAAVEELTAGAEMVLTADGEEDQQKAASLIKLFIMAAVYQQIEDGSMSESGDVQDLLNKMITISDNESANQLLRRLGDGQTAESGMNYVQEYLNENGYEHTEIGRELGAYENSAEENYTSVHDCTKLMAKIYSGDCVSAEASEKMLALLKGQERMNKIPAGLPEDIEYANKTGELPDVESDTAIVFGAERDYVISVIVTEVSQAGKTQEAIAEISGFIYEFLNPME